MNKDLISEVRVRGGSIRALNSRQIEETRSYTGLRARFDEVACHWFSSKDAEFEFDDENIHHFKYTRVLVIGGPPDRV